MVATLTLLQLVGGALLILSNGFFVTTEFALTRVRQFPRSEFSEGNLARAWEMTDRLEIYLSGCQLGITVSSVSLGVVAEPAVTSVLDAGLGAAGLVAVPASGHALVSIVIAVGLINLVHVIGAEQAPTYLGIERTKFVCRWGATPLYLWTKATWPVIWASDRVAKWLLSLFGVEITRSWTGEGAEDEVSSRSELRRQMGDALRGAGISGERQREVIRALEIGDLPVEEIMVPRDEIVALRTTDPLEGNLRRIQRSRYVRFPLVDGELDAYRGNVYTPSVLEEVDRLRRGETTLSEIAAPTMTVDRDAVISEVIDRFQEENQELALVLDGDAVVGLVTATDAFETIIGELEDPLDVEDGA